MKNCIKMRMKTCFHSHFYANFHASVTLVFLLIFSRNFHKNVELKNWNDIHHFGKFCRFFKWERGWYLAPKSLSMSQFFWAPQHMLKPLSAHVYILEDPLVCYDASQMKNGNCVNMPYAFFKTLLLRISKQKMTINHLFGYIKPPLKAKP